ncbi:hypothetical protein AB4Y67_16765 [Arthrobacter sp. YAF17]|uniref:hypothetical protein n=1 Tax=Arthrobacter sp. YAF17 TaxID=3233077 RepID=UPI003F8ED3CC
MPGAITHLRHDDYWRNRTVAALADSGHLSGDYLTTGLVGAAVVADPAVRRSRQLADPSVKPDSCQPAGTVTPDGCGLTRKG